MIIYIIKGIKYDVKIKYRSISAKWKRKYNNLSTVLIPKIEEDIEILKKDLSVVRRKITNNVKKLEEYEKLIDSEEKQKKDEIYNNNQNIKNFYKSIDDYENRMAIIKSDYDRLSQKIDRLEGEIKKENEQSNALKEIFNSDRKKLETVITKLMEIKDEKEKYIRLLRFDEQEKRRAADKSLFSKKKKNDQADDILYIIQGYRSEITKIDRIIEDNNQLLNNLKTDFQEESEKREKIIQDIESEVSKLDSMRAIKQKEHDELFNAIADIENNKKTIENSNKDLKNSIKEVNDKVYYLKQNIDADRKSQSELETKLDKLNKELEKLKNK